MADLPNLIQISFLRTTQYCVGISAGCQQASALSSTAEITRPAVECRPYCHSSLIPTPGLTVATLSPYILQCTEHKVSVSPGSVVSPVPTSSFHLHTSSTSLLDINQRAEYRDEEIKYLVYQKVYYLTCVYYGIITNVNSHIVVQ